MWSCPYCHSREGLFFRDENLLGVLCLAPDCGRFNELDEGQWQALQNAEG
jgi:hypothetical protein